MIAERYIQVGYTLEETASVAMPLALVKDHLRVTNDAEDAVLVKYIRAAMTHLEREYSIALIERSGSATFYRPPRQGGALELPVGPVRSVVDVRYNTVTAPNTWTVVPWQYWANLDLNRARIVALQDTSTVEALAIRVNFTAGFSTTAANLPTDILECINLLVADMHINKQDSVRTMPTYVEYLMRSYRVVPTV